MNITSFNITDVGYHYIGLRVIASLPAETAREVQFSAVSRNVLKYATDKALRLMLPEPRGDFQAVGEKVCQELVHLDLAEAQHGKGYSLTDAGRQLLKLLNEGNHLELRRKMVDAHVRTYDNLRHVLAKQLNGEAVWSPLVDAKKYNQKPYIERVLKPTFGAQADAAAEAVLAKGVETAKKTEDLLRDKVIRHVFPNLRMSLALFRSMSDRLVSLRLLNIMRTNIEDCEFAKSYSPCYGHKPQADWYTLLPLILPNNETFSLYLSEPNMKEARMQQVLLVAIEEALPKLTEQAGYYDLPQVRDRVCAKLMIPEAAFDDGVNELLDIQPPPVTVGLTYEGISGRRKPLVRNRESTQIFNLIRRA